MSVWLRAISMASLEVSSRGSIDKKYHLGRSMLFYFCRLGSRCHVVRCVDFGEEMVKLYIDGSS